MLYWLLNHLKRLKLKESLKFVLVNNNLCRKLESLELVSSLEPPTKFDEVFKVTSIAKC